MGQPNEEVKEPLPDQEHTSAAPKATMPVFVDAGSGMDEEDEEGPWTDAGNGMDEYKTKAEEWRLHNLRVIERQKADAQQMRESEPDIIKRARALSTGNYITFKNLVNRQLGAVAESTDENRQAVLDALFEGLDEKPHLDTFRGRIVDHQDVIMERNYYALPFVNAMSAAGLHKQTVEGMQKFVREWAKGHVRNDLIRRVEKRIPEWDGKKRMQAKLIDLFDCRDTELNRDFGEYFWLSLYCRVMHPGCNAPIVLSLFGAQNAGKSYFSKRLCQIILGSADADSVQLNFDSGDGNLGFLRAITGRSIVANVGEMAGIDRGDLNKIKDFVVRPSDSMHYKYEGDITQQRQWIIVMDGNRYDGLQKDDTGNRRFYPMFVGQVDDREGQPAWREDFAADFSGFEQDVWQIMAEAREWLAANGGLTGYHELVTFVSNKVKAFNRDERAANRGTSKDPVLNRLFFELLSRCEALAHVSKKADVPQGVKVLYGDFHAKYLEMTKKEVNSGLLALKVAECGGEVCKLSKNKTYLFWPHYTLDEFKTALDEDDDGAGLVKKEFF